MAVHVLRRAKGNLGQAAQAVGQIILGTHTGFADYSGASTFITNIGGTVANSVLRQYSNAQDATWATQLNNWNQGGNFWNHWPGLKSYNMALQITATPRLWTDVTAGVADTAMNTAFTGLAGAGVDIIPLGWEFNDITTSYPWAVRGSDTPGDQAGFVAAYQYVHGLANAIAPGFFKFWWNAANGVNQPLADIFTNYYPGDAYVDAIGLDIYNHYPGNWPGDAAFLTALTTGNDPNWNDTLAFCIAHGKDLVVPEFGRGTVQ